MTIKRKGKFLIDMELVGGLSIGIESDKLSACVKEARRRKAVGVFGAQCFGFKQDNLSFLAEMPDLTSIWFWDVELNNIEGVYELKHIKKFGLNKIEHNLHVTFLFSLFLKGFCPLRAGCTGNYNE